MHDLLFDLLGSGLATLIFPLAVILPGLAFAALLPQPFFGATSRGARCAQGLLLGIAILPLPLDYAGRLLGANAMITLDLALALIGARILLATPRAHAPTRQDLKMPLALWAAWLLLTLVMLTAWPYGERLHVTRLVADHLKHASLTWMIHETGTPPLNFHFQALGEHVSYYFYFHALAAMVKSLGGPLVDARHAVFGGVAWVLPAVFILARDIAARISPASAGALGRRDNLWLAALLCASGVEIVLLVILTLAGKPLLWTDLFDDHVLPIASSVLWVPQHVCALISAWVGFLTLLPPAQGASSNAPWDKADLRRVLLAGAAFAATLGYSAYVVLGAVATCALWFVALALQRQWRLAVQLAASGLAAALLALPMLRALALRSTDAGDPAQVIFKIRNPILLSADPATTWTPLPFNLALFHLLYFGVFALGAWTFWRMKGRTGLAHPCGVVLALSALASLLVGNLFVATALANNLGWRVLLFAQFAMVTWTWIAVREMAPERRVLMGALTRGVVIGVAGAAICLAQDFKAGSALPEEGRLLADERRMWTWANANLPALGRVQMNPPLGYDVVSHGFGLYSHLPQAMGDQMHAEIFGASKSQIALRASQLSPLFSASAPPLEDVKRTARALGIKALIVSRLDPVWSAANAWTQGLAPAYENARYRVYVLEGRT